LHTHIHTHTHTHKRTHTHVSDYIHPPTHTQTHRPTHTRPRTHTDIYTHTDTHTHTTCVCVCACVCACVCVCVRNQRPHRQMNYICLFVACFQIIFNFVVDSPTKKPREVRFFFGCWAVTRSIQWCTQNLRLAKISGTRTLGNSTEICVAIRKLAKTGDLGRAACGNFGCYCVLDACCPLTLLAAARSFFMMIA